MSGDLRHRIDSLSPEKRALLERRLLQQRVPGKNEGIPRRAPGERVPLSFSQQRLWFLDQWNPGAPTYNAALPVLMRGELDRAALKRALECVVARHEAVRTVFRVDDEGPVQVVLEDWSFDLPTVDLRDVPNNVRTAELERLLREHSRRPFDLANDLMLRATLFQLGDDEHVLLFQEHHIAFDGWSDGIMFKELGELYDAFRSGRELQLPEPPIQYADFALWQRGRMQGGLLGEHVEYWARQLAGPPKILRLPTDYPRPPVQTFEGAHHYLRLSAELAEGVRELSRSEGVTPFMTLLAAFAALLYRWTGEDDILVGSPIANRGRVELETLIGFFSNTLVLRTRLAGNPSFRELIARVRETALGAYAHQDLPFEKIVEAADPVRDPSANPLFQVNFRVQAGTPTTLELAGIEAAPLVVDVGFSRFDLALELQLEEDAIAGYVEYNTELFRPETARQIAAALEQLLAAALPNPDARLLELGPFTALEDDSARQRRPGRAIRSFRERATTSLTETNRTT